MRLRDTRSKPSGSFRTTGKMPVSDRNRLVRSRAQGGVGPGANHSLGPDSLLYRIPALPHPPLGS